MAMNHSSFYRFIRPMLSSTFVSGKDALHGGILKQYHHSYNYGFHNTPPYSLICPWYVPQPLCESDLTAPRSTSYEILGPGMILLREYVTLKEQWIYVKSGHGTWGVLHAKFPKWRRAISYVFGRNWDPLTRYNNPYKSDGSEPPPIPYELTSLAETAIQDAQTHLDDDDELPSMCPDTCSVSFYRVFGSLALHQDIDESSDSLERGLPVVSISIGEWGEFWYGHAKSKLYGVILKSGDVLIFGGRSRLIYHGVKEISQYCSPPPLIKASGLKMGRLNLTLRQF